ncbi:hypothetical protein GGX14DRAFT_627732 [Mycena pura]|uniref:F-box domain-containing protein n=1 Tax=Mycena pura TaxID=153505 RepID=A0AAD6YR60_9AGAR|nr:hypothetical protein GGX14DRAFT_627732 [Mycena pura]
MVGLLDLPDELLLSLPQYIRNIEDFTEFAFVCRRLHAIFNDTDPNVILQLAAASAPTFFHPHPWFLVLATARQIATWAVGNIAHTEELIIAFRGGVDGFLALSLQHAGLSLADIRRLHLARFDVINPLADHVDKMIGTQWYTTPDFWDGGVSDAFTLYGEIEPAVFQLLTYGELFGPTMEAFLQPEAESGVARKGFDLNTRLEYIKYCIPDWILQKGLEWEDADCGIQVLPVGPYAPDAPRLPGNQTALCHLLGGAMFSGGRWRRLWTPVLQSIGPDFEEKWRQKLWWDAATQVGGIAGMAAVVKEESVPEKSRLRLKRIYEQVGALDAEKDIPGFDLCGKLKELHVSHAPDLAAELYVCCSAWGPNSK